MHTQSLCELREVDMAICGGTLSQNIWINDEGGSAAPAFPEGGDNWRFVQLLPMPENIVIIRR